MDLRTLLECDNGPAMEIAGITCDSRAVRKDFLFVALPGVKFDGRDYIPDAIRHGARAIVVPAGTGVPDYMQGMDEVAWIEDKNPRHRLAVAAAKFYGAQPETIVAVTGTNGKTSVVNFTAQIWEKMGFNAASLGTLGLKTGNAVRSGSMTTPDPVHLHSQMRDLVQAGIDHLAIEASSHGLDQSRLDGVNISAAGFTNITHDHLDYHGSMTDYAKSKAHLFGEVLKKSGVAVLNADSPEIANLERICSERGIKTWTYGYNGREMRVTSRTALPDGQKVAVEIFGQKADITVPLVGEFQLMNLLCATGLVLARAQKRVQEVIDILPSVKGVAGRLEKVAGHKKGASVYVDYAHTPDALEHVLKALRPHTAKMLICIIGCGGDRDRAKRPEMGRIAAQLADIVIITDDNPRHENAAKIRAEIKSGAPQASEIADRAKAIRTAIEFCKAGDILLIAGKGHEHGQIFGDIHEPFDDVEQARHAMQKSP